jgi:hypothetical protein
MCGYSPDVWPYATVLRSREYRGRTPQQKGEGQHNLPNDLLSQESASHSRFQLKMRDLGRHRQMPRFALSRRQCGFESCWGHTVGDTRSNPLTRPNAPRSCASLLATPDAGRSRRTHARAVGYFDAISFGPQPSAAGCPYGVDSHAKPLHTTQEGRFLQPEGKSGYEPDCWRATNDDCRSLGAARGAR